MAVHMSARLRRNLLLLLPVAALLLPAAPSQAARAGCSSAEASAARVSARVAGDAVLCLVNAERAAHGLRPLSASPALRTAAQRFSAQMVDDRFFAHVSPAGSTVSERVRRAGYRMERVGENIGWGTGRLATPAAIVRGWMNSPPHRAIILTARFREGGVGVTRGTPVAVRGRGATYVLDVGSR